MQNWCLNDTWKRRWGIIWNCNAIECARRRIAEYWKWGFCLPLVGAHYCFTIAKRYSSVWSKTVTLVYDTPMVSEYPVLDGNLVRTVYSQRWECLCNGAGKSHHNRLTFTKAVRALSEERTSVLVRLTSHCDYLIWNDIKMVWYMITNLYLEYLSHRNNQSQVQKLNSSPSGPPWISPTPNVFGALLFLNFSRSFYLEAVAVIRDLEVDLTQNNQLQQGYRQGKNFYSCEFLNNALLHIDRTSKNNRL